jgi:hypothetical protein
VRPTAEELSAPRPGDRLVPDADVVMDRAFTLEAPVERVWPWFVQLGKHRGGWYVPRVVELVIAPRHRATRRVDPVLQGLQVGDVIPDWGGRDATLTVAELDAPSTIVHRSRRGRTDMSWSINLAPTGLAATRVHLRLRLGPVRRRSVAEHAGGLIDWLTIAGLAAGLRERVSG